MSDAFQSESLVEVGALSVKHEMLLVVVKLVPCLCHSVLLAVFRDLAEVTVRGFEPIANLDILEVVGDKNEGVVHVVSRELGQSSP